MCNCVVRAVLFCSMGWLIGALVLVVVINGCSVAYAALNKLQIEIERGSSSRWSRYFIWVTGKSAVFRMFLRLSRLLALAFFVACLLYAAPNVWMIVLGVAAYILVGWGAAGVCFKLYPLPLIKTLMPLLSVFYVVLYPLSVWLARFDKKEHTAVETAQDYVEEVVEESLNDLRENYDSSPEYSEERRMVQNVMTLRKSKVRDCMTPSADIVRAAYNTPLDELLTLFTATGFSKILIYKEQADKIVGYVHAYDLFRKPAPQTIEEIIRPVYAVPETTSAGALLKEMIEKHKSIAAVFDANGAVSGILTLEDLMEEIFGEIEDEFDQNNPTR